MKEANRNWSSLPVEITNKIFQLAVDHKKSVSSCHFALVCKSWLIPAQEVLYKSVKLSELPRLIQFCNTVKQADHIGEKVKAFHLDIPNLNEDEKSVTFTVLSDLLLSHLPNLEELINTTFCSFLPVLNALQDSRLKRLKKINKPDFEIDNMDEMANYANCALFLKDRIDHVDLFEVLEAENQITYQNPYFKHLYDNLHQFEKLEDLNNNMQTINDIEALEYILGSCKSLKTLTLNIKSPSSSLHNSNVSIEAISKFEPIYHIKTLRYNYPALTNDCKLLLYLMHKFPRLQELDISIATNGTTLLNQDVLLQLLIYAHDKETCIIDYLRMDMNAVSKTYSQYLKSVSDHPRIRRLHIHYTDTINEGDPTELTIANFFDNYIATFGYPSTSMLSPYVDSLKENGMYINDIEFRLMLEDNPWPKYDLPSSFLEHVFACCPNLRSLEIESCIIKRFTHSKIDFSRKIELDDLFLDKCILYRLALEQISMLVTKLKLFRIFGFSNSAVCGRPLEIDDSPNDPILEIVMTHTEIGSIWFKDLFPDKITLVKLFVVSEGVYYYYKYTGKATEISNKEEYIANGSDDIHVYICCKTKPNIRILGYNITYADSTHPPPVENYQTLTADT